VSPSVSSRSKKSSMIGSSKNSRRKDSFKDLNDGVLE
jgi:hypothetical protein